jgi:hypothetical protein
MIAVSASIIYLPLLSYLTALAVNPDGPKLKRMPVCEFVGRCPALEPEQALSQEQSMAHHPELVVPQRLWPGVPPQHAVQQDAGGDGARHTCPAARRRGSFRLFRGGLLHRNCNPVGRKGGGAAQRNLSDFKGAENPPPCRIRPEMCDCGTTFLGTTYEF